MKLKKAVVGGAVTALFLGSALNVYAAKTNSDDYVSALKESGKIDLIIDVDAYRAAYSDLEEAFGDDEDAYIEHYLTTGVYEGRERGILFDPLAYAEAYSDVKEAFGNDISSIIDHYLAFGVEENRTAGTANGYTDIAEAEKGGVRRIPVQRAAVRAGVYGNDAAGSTTGERIASSSISDGSENNAYTADAAGSAEASDRSSDTSYRTAASAPASAASAPESAAPAENASTGSESNNYRTTSIYKSDETTLWRVEYYDEDNKLREFSEVNNFDSSTNSYTEEVYENLGESYVHDRTDTYVNGVLVSSEKH